MAGYLRERTGCGAAVEYARRKRKERRNVILTEVEDALGIERSERSEASLRLTLEVAVQSRLELVNLQNRAEVDL